MEDRVTRSALLFTAVQIHSTGRTEQSTKGETLVYFTIIALIPATPLSNLR